MSFLAMVLFLFLACHCASAAEEIVQYCNPLDVSVADPQVLKDGDMYYLYGTTIAGRGYEVFSSKDMVHWRREGICYKKTKNSWGQDSFWAPETIKHDGKYYLFFTSRSVNENMRNISVAISDSPLGPFEEVGKPLFHKYGSCIDGHPYLDEETGRYYLYVCMENERPCEIRVARLSEDLLSLDSEPKVCFIADEQYDRNWVEGPYIIKHKSLYYMTYSRNGYSSPLYGVCYATAKDLMGPWTKYSGNPILTRTALVSGPGHNSLVWSPDGKELFIAYHTHLTFKGGGQRQLAIDRLEFVPDENGPDILRLQEGATVSPQPLPSGSKPMSIGASDEFDGDSLDRTRWTVFGENDEKWWLKDGSLIIETQPGDFHEDRIDAKNLFLQYAPEEDFSIETKVNFKPENNYEQAFLLIWQDQSNYIRFSTLFALGRHFENALELNGVYESATAVNEIGDDVYLKIEKKENRYRMFYSKDGLAWIEHPRGFEFDFTMPKIGLGAISPESGASLKAEFEYFRISQ